MGDEADLKLRELDCVAIQSPMPMADMFLEGIINYFFFAK